MTIIAIITGPIIAVIITLWYQSRKQKQDTKVHLFLTLMAHRKSSPPTIDWVNSLNLIDVVFENNPEIVKLWHDYYDLLLDTSKDIEKRQHKYIELLSSIAKSLGYKNLQQTDIDKFYSPVAHGDQAILTAKIQKELLRVLENTQSLEGVQSQNKQNDKIQ